MTALRIPLFPLDVVLFPGAALPLHIFELRYKLMIRRCVEKKLEFGVVLNREGGIAAVGCTAAIVQMARTYPDGKMDILTEGRSACQVLEVFEDKPYLEANVEILTDEIEAAPGAEKETAELEDLFSRCHELIFGERAERIQRQSPQPLSFQIAGKLPLESADRQEILEMRRESERRSHLLLRLHEWIPQLEQTQRMRKKAGGNGHGRA